MMLKQRLDVEPTKGPREGLCVCVCFDSQVWAFCVPFSASLALVAHVAPAAVACAGLHS